MGLTSTSDLSPLDRETQVQLRLQQLRELAEAHLRSLAETLVDTPPERLFGRVEFELRDRAHRLVCEVHQVALDGDKKRATSGRAESVPPATPTPDTSATGLAMS